MIYKSEIVQKIEVSLSEEEIKSFNKVYKVLEAFNSIIHTDDLSADIVSDLTGECFDCKELGRVCGILSAFMDEDNRSWTVG